MLSNARDELGLGRWTRVVDAAKHPPHLAAQILADPFPRHAGCGPVGADGLPI
jgi:hypothetical protein